MVIIIHPESDMVVPHFMEIYQMVVKTLQSDPTKVNLLVALDKKSGEHQSH